ERALAGGASTIVGLVLAPHYSRMSIGAYKRQLEDAVAGRAQLVFVDRWGAEPGFVEILADRVRGTDAHVVFTAHSLPARIREEGDPYERQLLETSELVANRAGLSDWSFSFQSESQTGEPWLGPDILDHLRELHGAGVRDVLVCPVGFVADHLEIRWDLDHEAAELSEALGLGFRRIEMPNADPAFVQVLAGLVRRVLSRIIKPTSGSVDVGGRVGSLLELGAGFHPDLSGRENVFLNGSIHGLKRAYIREQLDEIVAFAGLEEFIDLPVRTYSSGMY